MSVAADPLSLQVQNATAEQIQAHNVTLPTAGFTIAGLTLTSVSGTSDQRACRAAWTWPRSVTCTAIRSAS